MGIPGAAWLKNAWARLRLGGEDLSADGPEAQRIRAELLAMVPLANASFRVAATGDGRGRGLYTVAPIDAGCYLLDYEGEELDEEQFAARYPGSTLAEYVVAVARPDGSQVYVDSERPIGAGSRSNLARFMNHDDAAPNCAMWTHLQSGGVDDPRLMLFALRDIAAGDELVWDYGPSYWRGRADME